MPLTIVRPGEQLHEDRRRELGLYLQEQWRRARSGRAEQVDAKYAQWQKAYSGVPLEEVRTVPFYKSSNFVVKLIRMYLDTFVARSLNIIFATRPLYVCDGLSEDIKDAWELYLNRKACYEWGHYQLCKELATQGNKHGTCIIKTIQTDRTSWAVSAVSDFSYKESKVTEYSGPESCIIPFDDFFIYPITATCIDKAEILFHRLRFIKEAAKRKVESGDWKLPEGQTVDSFAQHPKDVQREQEQADAGIIDPYLMEMTGIECHLKWAITNDSSKEYNVVAVLEPTQGLLLDVYYNPYPQNLNIFQDYRPFPRDDIFFGESMCEILGQSQEEASAIHNARRDNSTIANSVCFKRRSGSLLPNPSTNWYPGKVWDLEDMADLDVFDIGRNLAGDLIPEEDYTFQLAEKLSGIGELMQGASQGMLGKRGVYNTGGTISVIAEGNQRQDTNIRDVRSVLSAIAKVACRLQATYGKDDPFIDTLPDASQKAVKQALQIFGSDKYKYLQLEVKASNAGANAEVRKANLMMMAQVLAQYGQTAVQMAGQLANTQLNPTVAAVMGSFIDMQRWMAARLLKELDEWDATEKLPDVLRAVKATNPRGGITTQDFPDQSGFEGMDTGGTGGAGQPVSREALATLASLPPVSRPGAPGAGMGSPQ